MKIEMLEKYPAGFILGFLVGFVVIHPFSMLFEGLFIPTIKMNLRSLIYAFHPQHIPMAVFFGILGMSLGAINIYYVKKIIKSKKRIKLLEGLLPICSYCHKIRNDNEQEHAVEHWERIEDYIYKKTDQEFTHGICPECVEKVFPQGNGDAREEMT